MIIALLGAGLLLSRPHAHPPPAPPPEATASWWSRAKRLSQMSVSSSGSGNVAAATLLQPSWDPLTAS